MDNFDLKKFLVENKLTSNSKMLKEVDTSNWGNKEDDYGRSEKDYRPKPSLADFDYDEEAYKKYMEDNFPGEPLEEDVDQENFKKDYEHCMDSPCTFGKGSPDYDFFEDNQDSWDTYINNFKDIGLSLYYDVIRNEYVVKKSNT